MTEVWHLQRVSDGEDDDDLEEVYVRHGVNPFANKAEVLLDDPDGDKSSLYPRPTLVELDVEVPGVLERRRRFAGFVQDQHHDRNETELLVLSHDFWIRKANDVFADFDNEPISSILEELVTTYTPLEWNPDLVEIENDVSISRRWVGSPLENICDEIRSISGGDELFGGTFDREFYFRPLGTESSPRSFGEGEYFDTEWDEDGKHAANRAVVTYGEGDDQATVVRNDGSAQRALAEAIGADGPVRIPVRRTEPSIETEDRAKDFADQLLEDRSERSNGVIETWEALETEPGQLTPVVDSDQEIDDEFRVAQLEYNWPAGNPPTSVTVADRALDTTDELVTLGDEVQKLSVQDVDPDAPLLETLEEVSSATLDVRGTIAFTTYGESRFQPGIGRDTLGVGRGKPGLSIDSSTVVESTSSRATNALLNDLRDVWRGEHDTVAIDALAIGDGDSAPSRNDTELGNELYRGEMTNAHSLGQTLARFESVFSIDDETSLAELGLFDDGDDRLQGRVTIDDVDVPAGVTVSTAIEIELADSDDDRGVVTTRGQEIARDAIRGEDVSDLAPTQMAFGVGDDDDNPEDTDLDDRVAVIGIESFQTRGTGRTSVVARIEESDAPGEAISELGQLNENDELLTRITFASIELTGVDLEATQLTGFANS